MTVGISNISRLEMVQVEVDQSIKKRDFIFSSSFNIQTTTNGEAISLALPTTVDLISLLARGCLHQWMAKVCTGKDVQSDLHSPNRDGAGALRISDERVNGPDLPTQHADRHNQARECRANRRAPTEKVGFVENMTAV